MAIILGKKPAPAIKQPQAPVAQAAKASVQPAPAPSQGPGLKFIKRGAAAQQQMEQEEKRAEDRKSQLFRFFLSKGETKEITFLDGDLKDGVLDIPFFHEHNLNLNGKWGHHFICTQDEEPCPICEGGDSPSYVGVFTIIDHSEYKDKNGKVHKDTVKLFVAKRDTIKDLQNKASKRGGLRGCRFDVTRVGDKSPSVGSSFDFTDKLSEAQLKAAYGGNANTPDRSKPADYEKMLAAMYKPASELRKMGFGAANMPIGSGDTGGDNSPGYDV